MSFEIILPEMGEGVIEGALTRWLVRAGEAVEAYAPVAEVETDKVTTELFSEVAGTVLTLHVQEGEIVPVGTVVATIRPQGEAHDARPLPAERAPLQRPPDPPSTADGSAPLSAVSPPSTALISTWSRAQAKRAGSPNGISWPTWRGRTVRPGIRRPSRKRSRSRPESGKRKWQQRGQAHRPAAINCSR